MVLRIKESKPDTVVSELIHYTDAVLRVIPGRQCGCAPRTLCFRLGKRELSRALHG